MFRLTLKLTTGILAALPALVLAAPVYVEYDTSVVDYCNCDGTGYHPGQRVAGWLKIDTDRAPPDRNSTPDPTRQIHSQYWMPNGPDFISGIGGPGIPLLGWDNSDEVQVIDDSGRFGFQGFALWDYSKNRGRPGATIVEMQLHSEDRVDDFIHGKGIAQSFDSKDLKGDLTFVGRITTQLKGVRHSIDLVLNRFSVTPGHCRAPG